MNDLYEKAEALVGKHQNASLSFLRRELNLSHETATEIMEELEKAGVVGPFTGDKTREVLTENTKEKRKAPKVV